MQRANPFPRESTPTVSPWPLPLVLLGCGLLFLAAPWPVAIKAHMLMHGLCAQRPSHSLRIGNTLLPFDARMTGIYVGAIAGGATLVLRGKHRAAHPPRLWISLALLGGVAAMATDGFDSLLIDLGRSAPYQPANAMRLATGLLTGVAIATVLAFLCAITFWRRPDSASRTLDSPADLAWLLAVPSASALLIWTAPGVLAAPIAIGLVVAALSVVSTLVLLCVVMLRNADRSFDSPLQLSGHAAAAVCSAVVVVIGLAGLRYGLEHWLGLVPLT